MVRSAAITNPWAPANNLAGWYGFGNNTAGKSVLSWCGRGVWKDRREDNQEDFWTLMKNWPQQRKSVILKLMGWPILLVPVCLFPSHPIISQQAHHSSHSNRDRDYTHGLVISKYTVPSLHSQDSWVEIKWEWHHLISATSLLPVPKTLYSVSTEVLVTESRMFPPEDSHHLYWQLSM